MTLAYDGTDFRGFVRQPLGRSLEGELLGVIDEVTGVRPRISVAGRGAPARIRSTVTRLEARPESGR